MFVGSDASDASDASELCGDWSDPLESSLPAGGSWSEEICSLLSDTSRTRSLTCGTTGESMMPFFTWISCRMFGETMNLLWTRLCSSFRSQGDGRLTNYKAEYRFKPWSSKMFEAIVLWVLCGHKLYDMCLGPVLVISNKQHEFHCEPGRFGINCDELVTMGINACEILSMTSPWKCR